MVASNRTIRPARVARTRSGYERKPDGKGAWHVHGLWMPGGDSTPYNAMTVDLFPDWNALLLGVPGPELWPKAHPNLPFTEFFNHLEKIRSIHDVEVYKIVDVVEGT